jgi:hypothetical protein
LRSRHNFTLAFTTQREQLLGLYKFLRAALLQASDTGANYRLHLPTEDREIERFYCQKQRGGLTAPAKDIVRTFGGSALEPVSDT